MLVTRKRETVWIRRSLTTPVKSRAMSSSMLMTLAGKATGSRAAIPSPARHRAKIRLSSVRICNKITSTRSTQIQDRRGTRGGPVSRSVVWGAHSHTAVEK